MNQSPEPKLKSQWKDGTRVWALIDITILAEEPYYHLRLVKGRHKHSERVVEDVWFRGKTELTMKACTNTAENCLPGRNWVRFYTEVKGYDSRPVKSPPVGPWWEDAHGQKHVLIIAYIPLQNSTPEEAEMVLKSYWPKATVIDSRVQDSIQFTSLYPCPKWWKDDGSFSSC
jgi:hypothetical protein